MTSIRLSSDQSAFYRTHGYLIVDRLLTDAEVREFLDRESTARPQSERLGLRTHTVDPVWRHIAHHPNIAGIAAQLLGGPPRIVQTMYLPKRAAAPDVPKSHRAGIALHQDTHYLPSEPNTLMACWIAMNDTDGENGGLCVVPGSHRDGLYSTHRNLDDDHASWETEHLMRDRAGREWKERLVSFQIDGLDRLNIVRLSVPQGAGVFFTGMTVHGSYANNSPTRERHAFAVHYVKDGTWLLRADVQETVLVETCY